MFVIGISAKAHCGKSTMAKALKARIPPQVEIMSFAEPLKDEVSVHFDIPRSFLDEQAKKVLMVSVGNRKMTIREVLQWWGDVRRQADPNYWVNKTVARIREYPVKLTAVILDDVRMSNEAAMVKTAPAWLERPANGLVVRLNPYDGWNNVAGDHKSETALDDYRGWDFVFQPRFGELDKAADAVAAHVNSILNRAAA